MKKFTSILVISLLICSSLLVISNVKIVKASDIIRIRDDGSVEGTDKIQRDGDVYTLTGNIDSSVGSNEAFIFVEKNNIIIDGAGYTLQGIGHGTAIYMLRKQNVTIKNFNIEGFETGINFWTVSNWPSDSKFWGLPPASNNQILDNNITVVGNIFGDVTEAGWAIYLQEAEGTLISGNTITSQDPKGGIYFGWTTADTSLFNNQFVTCRLYIRSSSQTVALDNTVDGLPLVFLDGASNQVIDNAGLIYLFNCENMTIKDIALLVDYGQTIQLSETRNTEITNCEGYITLTNSSNNTIHNNNPKTIELSGSNYNKIFTNTIVDTGICIKLHGASNYNEIYGNILLNSSRSADAAALHYSGKNAVGIRLGDGQMGGCQYNNIYWNNIINHDVGIECYSSSNNSIYANYIADSNVGISFSGSYQNRMFENNVTECGCAVSICGSDNAFYHNNFVENERQVSIRHQTLFTSDIITEYSTNNTFDLGDLSGGNFWSDYNGTDTDGDGIGDTPYIINEDNQDNYPLMNPVATVIPEFSSWIILLLFLTVTLVVTLYRKRLAKPPIQQSY